MDMSVPAGQPSADAATTIVGPSVTTDHLTGTLFPLPSQVSTARNAVFPEEDFWVEAAAPMAPFASVVSSKIMTTGDSRNGAVMRCSER